MDKVWSLYLSIENIRVLTKKNKVRSPYPIMDKIKCLYSMMNNIYI